jgi:hypothetical protein
MITSFGKLLWFDYRGNDIGNVQTLLIIGFLLNATKLHSQIGTTTTTIKSAVKKAKRRIFPFQELHMDVKRNIIDFLTAQEALKLSTTCKGIRSDFSILQYHIPICRQSRRWSISGFRRFLSWNQNHNIAFLFKLDSCEWDPRFFTIKKSKQTEHANHELSTGTRLKRIEIQESNDHDNKPVILAFEDVPLLMYHLYMVDTTLVSISAAWIQLNSGRVLSEFAPLTIIACRSS